MLKSLFIAVAFLFITAGIVFIWLAINNPKWFHLIQREIHESKPWVRQWRRFLTIVEGMFFIAVGISLFLKSV